MRFSHEEKKIFMEWRVVESKLCTKINMTNDFHLNVQFSVKDE